MQNPLESVGVESRDEFNQYSENMAENANSVNEKILKLTEMIELKLLHVSKTFDSKNEAFQSQITEGQENIKK